jgi:hypothetical protein
MEQLGISPPKHKLQRKRSSSSDEPSPRLSPAHRGLRKRSLAADDFFLNRTSEFPLGGKATKVDARENGGLAFGGITLPEIDELSKTRS